jgi:hypothetical protein
MDFDNEVMRALGRIEGRLEEILKANHECDSDRKALSERVSKIERWQAWLKGAWAVCAAAFAVMLKGRYGK